MCAKAGGQKCNGWCGMYGKCAEELYCDLPIYLEGTLNVNYAGGICRQNNPNDDCCERKVLKETQEVFTLDTVSGTKALDICLDSCVYRKEGDDTGELVCFKKGNGTLHQECILKIE